MRSLLKNDNTKIILIVLIVSVIGLAVRFTQPPLCIDYPEQDTILAMEDFTVRNGNGEVTVGFSSWDEAITVFPGGESLGLSTIYRPESDNCLLQFTEEENILDKMHIYGDQLTTNRGIKIGDSFDTAEACYGPDYARVTRADRQGYFEAVYGCGNNKDIVFQVQDQKVVKIILQQGICRR